MAAWKRIGFALLFLPLTVYAQQSIFEPVFPLLRGIVEILGFKWLNPSLQPYALKTILFIMYAVLISHVLQKTAKLDRKISNIIAISFSAIGILFLPDSLSERLIGSQFGNITGLIGLLLPLAITMYFLFRQTGTIQNERWKKLSRGLILLLSGMAIGSSLTYLGIQNFADGVFGVVSLLASLLMLLGFGYLLFGATSGGSNQNPLTAMGNSPLMNNSPNSAEMQRLINEIQRLTEDNAALRRTNDVVRRNSQAERQDVTEIGREVESAEQLIARLIRDQRSGNIAQARGDYVALGNEFKKIIPHLENFERLLNDKKARVQQELRFLEDGYTDELEKTIRDVRNGAGDEKRKEKYSNLFKKLEYNKNEIQKIIQEEVELIEVENVQYAKLREDLKNYMADINKTITDLNADPPQVGHDIDVIKGLYSESQDLVKKLMGVLNAWDAIGRKINNVKGAEYFWREINE